MDESCIFNSFILPTKLAETPIGELDKLSRRLAWLDGEMGRIDYSLLPKSDVEKSIKVIVHFLSLKEE